MKVMKAKVWNVGARLKVHACLFVESEQEP